MVYICVLDFAGIWYGGKLVVCFKYINKYIKLQHAITIIRDTPNGFTVQANISMLNSTGLVTRTSKCRFVYGIYTQLLIQLGSFCNKPRVSFGPVVL